MLNTPPPLQLLTLKHRPAVGLGVAWSWGIAEIRHWSQLAHTRLPHSCKRGFAVHNHSCHSREMGMRHRLGSHRCNLRKGNGFVLYPTMQNRVYDEEDWSTVLKSVTHTCQKRSKNSWGLRSLNLLAQLEVLAAERRAMAWHFQVNRNNPVPSAQAIETLIKNVI